MKKTVLALLPMLALLALSGCADVGQSSPDNIRLNEVYQFGQTGDVWECKEGRCYQVR